MTSVLPSDRLLARLFRRPAPFSTGLTRRRRRAEEKVLASLLQDGTRSGAFDDGTVHLLDGHLAARRRQFTHHLDAQAVARTRRAARRVAKVSRTAERHHARLLELEAQLQRVEANLLVVDGLLRGSPAEAEARPAFTRLDGPRLLDGHGARAAVAPADPTFPSAVVRPLHPSEDR